MLGPGRSGTSGIARAFTHAGFFAGAPEDMLGPGPGNPLGHYEPLPVLRLNEELLADLGWTWWAATPTREDQLAIQGQAAPRLRAVLDSLIKSSAGAPVIVKEPRISSLLPLWGPHFDGRLHPVLAIRDPLEVAMSHASRDETPVAHALAAWEMQITMLLEWLDGRTVTLAPYAQITARPELAGELVAAVARHLEVDRAERLRSEEAKRAIRPDLRHEGRDGLVAEDFLTKRQAALWNYLGGLPPGDARMAVPPSLLRSNDAARMAVRREDERVKLAIAHADAATYIRDAGERNDELERRLIDAYANSEALLHSVTDLNRRVGELERDLGEANDTIQRKADELLEIQSSMSWRLTRPLRAVKRSGLHGKHPG